MVIRGDIAGTGLEPNRYLSTVPFAFSLESVYRITTGQGSQHTPFLTLC